MFKKILCAFLVLAAAVSFCACSSSGDLDITFKRKITTTLEQETTQAETTEPQTEAVTEEQTTQATENNAGEYSVTQQVNVRSNPDYNSEILGQLMYGETVSALSVENGWAVIDYNGGVGYVSIEYLSSLI